MELLASPKHYSDIKSERAIATIRFGKRDITPGDEIIFKSNDPSDESVIPCNCSRVTFVCGKDLSPDELGCAGLDQIHELGWKELSEVYPNAKQDDVFSVIYFTRQ